ncbi:MAG TPA: carboxypeptidase-like regulatory domain-containing protein [Candidatus Andersenbacteria bacterium]|nr:carboxypeptidase-like regulatory domain-containing protein [Candidatus Andersenbacteria bacterium]
MVASPRGRVVDIRTGAPIASAQVMIYDASGKLHSTLTTNAHGEFSTTFPAGAYGLTVYAPGYMLAAEASQTLPKTADVMYDGGVFTVKHDDEPIDMIVPVQSSTQKKYSLGELLRASWQSMIFFAQKRLKKSEASQGIIRDVSTKQPLDLAAVRLFDEKNGQLIATRISDIYGTFSLFPSPGMYRMTVTREGYEEFVREHIPVPSSSDVSLFQPVDLIKKDVL